jgi:BirA family biotin operon repressor/biotin-[acetyl-CoA-carboxylase] ligase
MDGWSREALPLARSRGAGRRLAGPVHRIPVLTSTQDRIRELARTGAPEGTVVVTGYQTAGRGQRGRGWHAAPGQALLFSCLLRPGGDPGGWPRLMLAAGLAVAEATGDLAGIRAELDWPNDVMVGDRKLAGILAEGSTDGGGDGHVALGVGVNVSQRDGDWPPELAGRAVSLAQLAAPVEADTLLAAILTRLEVRYRELLGGQFLTIREAWLARARPGQAVETPAGVAVVTGLSPDGQLVVRGPDGRAVVIHSRSPA